MMNLPAANANTDDTSFLDELINDNDYVTIPGIMHNNNNNNLSTSNQNLQAHDNNNNARARNKSKFDIYLPNI